MKKYVYKTSISNILIKEEGGKICGISYTDGYETGTNQTPLIKETCRQLEEYFSGVRKVFDIPLLLEGTDFQIKVWKALCQIGYGETASYGDIARIIGHPRAWRAVGRANNKNKIVIIIPCHRIIGSNGSLTGYAGSLDMKKYLLDLEKKNF